MSAADLRSIGIKDHYRHNRDDLISDFYIPMLKSCRKFYRAAGYFSSSIFDETILGLAQFLNNNGVLRIVTSFNLTESDIKALKNLSNTKKQEYITKSIANIIIQSVNGDGKRSTEIFCWLIANKKLELKIAFGASEDNFLRLYHEKIGLFESLNGDWLAFKGSVNESKTAFTLNFESIEIFKSWEDSDFSRFNRIKKDFEELWANSTDGLQIIDLDNEVLDTIEGISKLSGLNNQNIPEEILKCETTVLAKKLTKKITKNKKKFSTPDWFINGIYEHQKNSYFKWARNGFNGFLEYATGSGKTLTALYCTQKLFEEEGKLFILILTPQIFIAEQWVQELGNFNLRPIKCYGGVDKWRNRLSQEVQAYNMQAKDIVAVVAVNATVTGPVFQNIIQNVNTNLIVIGDEAHNLGAENNLKALPKNKKYSIGLSATPTRFMDEEGTERMLNYFGGVIDKFELKDALKLKILTPYYYNIILVHLTADEEDEFTRLTEQISRLSAQNNSKESSKSEEMLKTLRIKRARILSNSKNKMIEFEKEMKNRKKEMKTIIYCGAGKNADDEVMINEVIKRFKENSEGKISKFTSIETIEERDRILKMLKNNDIEVIAAIKCLDEGVDLPAVEAAYFMASGVNEKEFIQRRGRVMRRFFEKKFSYIYDFVVVPRVETMDKKTARALFNREFTRVKEFAELAMNKHQALEKINYVREYLK